MGRLEKQIIVGAIALVAVLLGVVVLTGVEPVDASQKREARSEWSGHGLLMPDPESAPATEEPLHNSAPAPGAGAASLSLDGPALEAGSGAEVTPSQGLGGDAPRPKAAQASPPAASTPASTRAQPLSLDPVDQLRQYEVQPGETLSEIAMRELGSMKDLDLLLEVNEGINKHQVHAGDQIWLPSRALADQRRAARQAAPAATTAAQPAASKTTSGRTHEVVSGDSLWRIAEAYYGREGATAGVKRLVAANARLKDENTVLRLGWILTIPE